MNGILLLDKPVGITSNQALQKAKRLLGADKAGHTGSLDPLASGMLPLCFGEATKFSRFLLESNKSYQAVMRLGITTTTGDSDGEVINTLPIPALSLEKITTMFSQFMGTQLQIPPMYSAIKHQGQPLYKLARKGQIIAREPRTITINNLALNNINNINNDLIAFTVECTKGTYIRTLVEDMGAYLGCGAHLIELRRLWVAPLQAYPMVTLHDLANIKQPLLPTEQVLSLLFPSLSLSASDAFYLRRGQSVLMKTDLLEGWVALLTESGEFLGVGEVAAGKVAPRRLIQQMQTLQLVV